MILWRLHQRITRLTEKIVKEENLSPELKIFDKTLSSKKVFMKEGDVYFVISYLGNAEGHISTLKITESKLFFEYNDHCPARTIVLMKRLSNYGWKCSEMRILKNVFPEKEVSHNYFFTAEKIYKSGDGELKRLATELEIGIDTDWILLDDTVEFTTEELDNEIKIVESAFMLYDIFKLEPRAYLDSVKILISVNERRQND
jgi:hypothetical protein